MLQINRTLEERSSHPCRGHAARQSLNGAIALHLKPLSPWGLLEMGHFLELYPKYDFSQSVNEKCFDMSNCTLGLMDKARPSNPKIAGSSPTGGRFTPAFGCVCCGYHFLHVNRT